MNTEQLLLLLSDDPVIQPYFLGVFPADHIPRPRQPIYCFVINIDPSSLPGRHWVCVYGNKTIEFFDSYGLSPRDYHLNLTVDFWNRTRVQDFDAESCGLHCVFYLQQRLRGRSVHFILQGLYSTNLLYNESLILRDLYYQLLNKWLQR